VPASGRGGKQKNASIFILFFPTNITEIQVGKNTFRVKTPACFFPNEEPAKAGIQNAAYKDSPPILGGVPRFGAGW